MIRWGFPGSSSRETGSLSPERAESLEQTIEGLKKQIVAADRLAKDFSKNYVKSGINQADMDSAKAHTENLQHELAMAYIKKLRGEIANKADKGVSKEQKEAMVFLRDRQQGLEKVLHDRYRISMQLESHVVLSDNAEPMDAVLERSNNEVIQKLKDEWNAIGEALE